MTLDFMTKWAFKYFRCYDRKRGFLSNYTLQLLEFDDLVGYSGN